MPRRGLPSNPITPREAARIGRVAVSTVYENIRRGRLAGYRVAGRAVFLDRSEVVALWVSKSGSASPSAGRKKDRYRRGFLAEAVRILGRGDDAAKPLRDALAENARRPYRDTRECARLTACLRDQLVRFGWESLPKGAWDEIERIAENHPGCDTWQVAQELRFLSLCRGEENDPRHLLVRAV